jgi:ferric-dicitrate binding protein FerR (iron transport regulator)
MNTRDSESSVERLIKLAGEPDLPTSEGMRRARAAGEIAWRQMLAQREASPRRGRMLMLGFALAASLALVAWLVIRPASQSAVPAAIGQVIALEGMAGMQLDGETTSISPDSVVFTGSILETSQGRLAIAFIQPLSLRVDRNTRLRFDGADHVTLLAGSLYVDSGGLNVSSPLRITTPAGEVSHVGTQFQVSVSGATTRVRVREGRVLVESGHDAASRSLAAGDELEIRGGLSFIRSGMPTFGADWEWAADVMPVLEIENRPFGEFLAWLVREQGWQLRYASDALQQQANEIRLHGSVEGLDLPAMLERVSLVTGIPLEERDGVLWVGKAR